MWGDLTSFYVFIVSCESVRICKTGVTEKCMRVWGGGGDLDVWSLDK